MFRKFYHLLGLIFPILLIIFSRKFALYAAGAAFVVSFAFDFIRLTFRSVNKHIFREIGFMFKPREKRTISGSPYFLAGVFITMLLFDPVYATGGIIFLGVGDASAAVIGSRFGRVPIRDKTLEGSLAFVVSTVIVLLVLKYAGVLPLKIPGIIAAAVVCSLVELFPLEVDDNFLLPIVGGLVLTLLG